MLHEFWVNFTHTLFKPLLLFFYFGFLIPIFKVRFEFPYVLYQGLTLYCCWPSVGTAAKNSPRSSRPTSAPSLGSWWLASP
ncbi:membrane permease [Mycobacterium tuberculosis]|nr:membrane permease [Mycobacterium tuberculosis]